MEDNFKIQLPGEYEWDENEALILSKIDVIDYSA
jgi:hypothetical protein